MSGSRAVQLGGPATDLQRCRGVEIITAQASSYRRIENPLPQCRIGQGGEHRLARRKLQRQKMFAVMSGLVAARAAAAISAADNPSTSATSSTSNGGVVGVVEEKLREPVVRYASREGVSVSAPVRPARGPAP